MALPYMPAIPILPATDQSEVDAKNARSIHLMLAIGKGDAAAFQELVELHQQAVIGTGFRLLGNVDDAHDLAQQVFLRIWKSAPRYQATAKFTVWMFTILRNLAFNEMRRKQTKPTESLDDALEAYGTQVIDFQASKADDALDEKELEEAVDAAIAALPDQQRLAISLRRHQDLAYEEIAKILGSSVSSVKSLLFRARTTLRERLAEWM